VVELRLRDQPPVAGDASAHDAAATGRCYPPLPEADAAQIFTFDSGTEYDPYSYIRRKALYGDHFKWDEHPKGLWTVATNTIGLREDRDLSPTRPDLRVLVTGDSHTDGACNNDESFPHVLEGLLLARSNTTSPVPQSFEVINAGIGGTSFHNYLGVLERFLHLEPHVFVFAVYGGNDFCEALTLHAYFHGKPAPPSARPYWNQVRAAKHRCPQALAQSLLSLKFFAVYPDQNTVALEAAREVTAHIRDVCERASIRLICVYIPPVTDVDPAWLGPVWGELCADMGLTEADLGGTNRLADDYLAWLAQQGIEAVDLRPAFRAEKESMYWRTDWHVNVKGHVRIAKALFERF
jgi:lysophospholipase L1-like esterase